MRKGRDNMKTYSYKGFNIKMKDKDDYKLVYNGAEYSFETLNEVKDYIDNKIKPNYCGTYGCKNCQRHKVYYSYDWYSPDEHECDVPNKAIPAFELSDEELEQVFDRVWMYGEEWEHSWEQICPYYKEHIDDRY